MHMSTKPHGHIRFLPLIAATFLLLSWSMPALAGGGASAESCSNLGYLTVKCFDCSNGPNVYKGNVPLWAAYNAANDTCITDSAWAQAREDCRETYSIGKKWDSATVKYTAGATEYFKRNKSDACAIWPPY